MNEPLRIGLVGAGRSRNGLGPFLASACEKAGARVVAVAARDAERAAYHAEELAQRLKHPVAAKADVTALCASGIDALVIASPQEAHLTALRAAVSNGLSCLCEKPLVDLRDAAAGLAVVQQFQDQGLVLHENAQWPFVLPVLSQLYSMPEGSPRLLEMGLSPMGGGALSMVADSLPHLLSLCLAVLPKSQALALELRSCTIDTRAAAATSSRLELHFRHPGGELLARLFLVQCPTQPRPAWFALDGRRVDRRIGDGYAISFVGNGAEAAVSDPMYALVEQFLAAATAKRANPRFQANEGGVDAVAVRLRLYAEVLSALGAAAS